MTSETKSPCDAACPSPLFVAITAPIACRGAQITHAFTVSTAASFTVGVLKLSILYASRNADTATHNDNVQTHSTTNAAALCALTSIGANHPGKSGIADTAETFLNSAYNHSTVQSPSKRRTSSNAGGSGRGGPNEPFRLRPPSPSFRSSGLGVAVRVVVAPRRGRTVDVPRDATERAVASAASVPLLPRDGRRRFNNDDDDDDALCRPKERTSRRRRRREARARAVFVAMYDDDDDDDAVGIGIARA